MLDTTTCDQCCETPCSTPAGCDEARDHEERSDAYWQAGWVHEKTIEDAVLVGLTPAQAEEAVRAAGHDVPAAKRGEIAGAIEIFDHWQASSGRR
jgi:hypothetical protein